jgi:fructokinase
MSTDPAADPAQPASASARASGSDQRGTRPAIGVDFGGTKIEAIVLDPAGLTLWRERVPTPGDDYPARLAAAAALVARAERERGLAKCSVGVGTPGALTANGLLKNSNSVCLNGRPLQADLARAMGRPVRIANDANCLALSEATDGAGAGADVVFAAILGTGVGAGVVVRGHVLSGPNGLGGEWGHNPLPWVDAAEAADTLPAACYCGQRGCIETWLSGPGMARDHAARTGQRLSAQQIAERAGAAVARDAAFDVADDVAAALPAAATETAAPDPDCDATLQRYESRLARALAHVINLLDPDVIVLGGGLSNIDRLYANVPRLWGDFVFSGGVRDVVRTRLVRSRHGDSSGVRGAAWLWRAG